MKIHRKNPAIILLLVILAAPATALAKPEKPQNMPNFHRAEFMLMNLNRGIDSAGTHLLASEKATRQMIKELDKSIRQMEQVNKEFAKFKGRPDDRFLGSAPELVQKALQTAQQLEKELDAAREELKSSIQISLAVD